MNFPFFLEECEGLHISQSTDFVRAIILGPAESWITVLDSAGNGDLMYREAFTRLAYHLSGFGPTVTIQMDDSAVVHLNLYANGTRRDRFANGKSVCEHWEDQEEANLFRGDSALWSQILGMADSGTTLIAAWRQERASEILIGTAHSVGWNRDFCTIGFTVDYDGIPEAYTEHLHDFEANISAFSESFWQLKKQRFDCLE